MDDMGERAAYSRVYWSVSDDPKFASIYGDDHHLAAWLRLLLIADQAYPASAHLPMNIRKASREALVGVGLIDPMPGDRYRIHGLDAERDRRRLWATTRGPNGVQSQDRTATERSPNGAVTQGLRLDETRLDEPRSSARASDERWDAPEMEAVQWLAKHGCDVIPASGYHRHLVTLVETHGIEAVVAMFVTLAGRGVKSGDVKGFIFGAKDVLDARSRPNLHALETEEAAEERAEVRSKRIQRQMWERRFELYRETGQWDEAWGEPPKQGAPA